MICPHCLKTIGDGETFCPHCHGYVGPANTDEFVFCEGCGARLSLHDRTCPKCGRPAPGILSTDSSSSDLAAGKTASFPRLTKSLIQTETPRVEPVSAGRVLDDSVDPSSTNVLSREDLDAPRSRKRAARAADEDPYHPRRRHWGRLVAVLLVVALAGGATAFITMDPLNVMPGFYESFRAAAREAFPSRQLSEMGSSDGATADDTGKGPAEPEDAGPLTDDEVFDKLTIIYHQIDSYNSDNKIGEVIDSFNSNYLLSDRAARTKASESAYALRDAIQSTIDEIDAIEAPEDTAYREDIDHMRQLAEWMYGRVDQICDSWDVSLSIPEGESMSSHNDEILRPMREAGSDDLTNFDTYFHQWEPERKDSATE